MGSTGEVKVTADCDCNCCSCCCGGMGFIRQAAEGSGTVFLNAGGTVVQKVWYVSSSVPHLLDRNLLQMKHLLLIQTLLLDFKSLSDLAFKKLVVVAHAVLVEKACSTLLSRDLV